MGSIKWDFSGSVVVVTGGARGQGREIAVQFAKAGAKVAIFDIASDIPAIPYRMATPEDLEETAREISHIGGEVLPIVGDVCQESDVERMVAEALEKFGKIDILVNNAGALNTSPCVDMTREQWDAVLNLCLTGPFLCSKHVARHMIERGEGGRIITTSSTSAFAGIPNQVAYQAAKTGVVGLVKALALEFAPYGITVNSMAPTVVADTGLLQYLETDCTKEYMEDVQRLNGASTIFPGVYNVKKVDAANGIMWLASDEARYVTGTVLLVDGGFTCK